MSATSGPGGTPAPQAWLDQLRWDEHGLMPAIAQDAATGRILMVAWMNREALQETARTRRGVYWSRSRGRLWRKGEESGNVQRVQEIRTDCDRDVILLSIEQVGGVACHTGRESCFFRRLETAAGNVAGQGRARVGESAGERAGELAGEPVAEPAGEQGAASTEAGPAGSGEGIQMSSAATAPAPMPLHWQDVDPVRIDPQALYGASASHHHG